MYRTLLHVGPLVIGSYVSMLTMAFLTGTLLAVARSKKYGIPPHDVVDITVLVIVASVLGSRALFVLQHVRLFAENPSGVFAVWQGGLSYHGGLLGSCVVGFWWLRKKKIPIRRMLDIIVPSLALGYFLVRIGCFLNGCCFGMPTDFPWGVVFPSDSPAGMVYGSTTLHPAQLYSSLWGAVNFLTLLGIEKKFQLHKGDGRLFFLFLILSALERFVVEFFRYQGLYPMRAGWFTEAQAYCIGTGALATVMIVRIHERR